MDLLADLLARFPIVWGVLLFLGILFAVVTTVTLVTCIRRAQDRIRAGEKANDWGLDEMRKAVAEGRLDPAKLRRIERHFDKSHGFAVRPVEPETQPPDDASAPDPTNATGRVSE